MHPLPRTEPRCKAELGARLGSIRLLVHGGEGRPELTTGRQDGTTTLLELLSTWRPDARSLLRVVA